MKLAFKVAGTELRNLFYSPIAWFLTIAFWVQCAIVYTNLLYSTALIQEEGGRALEFMSHITYRIFNDPYGGLFSNVMQNLYLYLPLLTMGLISREINVGTISLLYSSPVRIREIVWGKYLAMMIYSLVLLSVVGVFITSGVFNIKQVDAGSLLSAMLGFYLLLCAYSAIGLFMSSLSSYQVVAAVSTFIMIGILSYIGHLWQGIDFVRDLTYFLSLNGRTQHMLSGLITTKDVLYFIIIVGMFLAFTIYKLEGARKSKPLLVKIARYAIVVVLALLTGYITSRPSLTLYWDTTANKENTLTQNAQKIIASLGDNELEVSAYTNFLDNYSYFGLPDQRNEYLSRWESYVRFKPDIHFRFISYYDTAFGNNYNSFQFYKGKTIRQIAEQQMKGLDLDIASFKSPEEIRREIDLLPEQNRFVMQLKYKDRTTFLRVFNDPQQWPSETEVSAAFKRLLQAKMPKIAFATGSRERSTVRKGERAYNALTVDKVFRYALINQGFDVDTVLLDTQPVPDSITVLVIADPINSLSPAAVQKVQQYINNGGNLLIAGEPGRQELLNPLIKPLGVQMTTGMLNQKSEDFAPSLVLPLMTKAAVSLSYILQKQSIDTFPVSMNGVAGLNYRDTAGFEVLPLLQIMHGAARNTMARNPDLDLVDDADAATVDAQAEKKKPLPVMAAKIDTTAITSDSSFTTMVALKRKVGGKEQRIIISGDADFMSNAELSRNNPRVLNFNFATALFSWFDNGEFPINTSRPDSKDNRVKVGTNQVTALKIAYIWVLPGVLLLLGTILLIRRKRR